MISALIASRSVGSIVQLRCVVGGVASPAYHRGLGALDRLRLTPPRRARTIRRKESDSSESSGIRTRQTCGFFVTGRLSAAGRGRKHNTRKGNTAHRLLSAINLPATMRLRVIAPPHGFIELKQETSMHSLAAPGAHPVVSLIDGQAVTTSLEVARVFGKRHTHVLEQIRALLKTMEETPLRNFPEGPMPIFRHGSYTLEITRDQEHPQFVMTRDGFALLAMGFTGKRALAFKLAYIDAFNRMEAELRERAAPPPSLRGRRWLLTIDDDGREIARALPNEAFVGTLANLTPVIGALGPTAASNTDLIALATICNYKLAERAKYFEQQANLHRSTRK